MSEQTPIPAEPLHPSNAPNEVCARALRAHASAQLPATGKVVAAIDVAYRAGLAAGRTAAAEDIRAMPYSDDRFEQRRTVVMQCARVAENGADHAGD